MSRRIEIELTSERPDGTWTWRAAGAKQPKGTLSASVLPDGAAVGDVLRADADFAIDGIEILSVLPPRAARKQPELLEIVGTGKDEPLVTTTLVEKRGRRGRGGRRERGERRGRDGDAPRGERRTRGPRTPDVPERPKPKRLRAGRAHRNAVLEQLPVEERPIAEQVLRGGVPAVREAIAKQNEQARAENRPEVSGDELVAMAEKHLPKLRAAEWLDKADAALADIDQLDLRDLRSVVVAADGNTPDEHSRELLAQLQEALARRVEEEQTNWIADMTANLDAGRFVRALRLSSRPPKAGTPLPPELATRLIESVSAGLTPTVNQDLWAAAVDALAFSPVRHQVVPVGRPEKPSEALLEAVKRVGTRLPSMVELFGLDPAEVAAAAKRRGRGGRGRAQAGSKRKQDKPAQDEPAQDKPAQQPASPPAESEAEIVADVIAEERTEAPIDAAVPDAAAIEADLAAEAEQPSDSGASSETPAAPDAATDAVSGPESDSDDEAG